MNFEEINNALNEESMPVLSLVVIIFVVVMGVLFTGAMLMAVAADTGGDDVTLRMFNQTTLWIVSIVSIIVVMVIAIGLNIVRERIK